MRAALVGNYGVGNVGDEALCAYFRQAFPAVRWEVLSAHPGREEWHRLPLGLRSLFGTPWWRTLGMLRHCDAVVFGGGSLLTDVESLRACFLWGLHALVARLLRKPLFLGFQGVGPFRTKTGEHIARAVCRRAAFVSVRDAASAKRLQAWGLPCTVSFDPVLALPQEQRCPGCSEDMLVLVPRFNSDAAFVAACTSVVAAHPGIWIEIWLFAPDNAEERRMGEVLAERFTGVVRRIQDVADLTARLPHVRHLVTQRYHGAIVAMAGGCPMTVVPQQDGDKLSQLLSGSSPIPVSALLERVRQGEEALRSAMRDATQNVA